MCTRAFTDKCSTGIVRGVNLLSMQNVIDELEGKCTVGSPKHVGKLLANTVAAAFHLGICRSVVSFGVYR